MQRSVVCYLHFYLLIYVVAKIFRNEVEDAVLNFILKSFLYGNCIRNSFLYGLEIHQLLNVPQEFSEEDCVLFNKTQWKRF